MIRSTSRWSRSQLTESSLGTLLLLCACVSLLTTGTTVFLLGKEAFLFFQQVGVLEFLFGTQWTPLIKPHSFGVLPLVAGTLHIVVGAMIIAIPLGIGTGIFLYEFAPSKLRLFLKPILEILAGVPTVVYGYFALTFVTPLLKSIFPDTDIFNAASGAIVVGIMILPMISSMCDDAFQSLPISLKEGAYALGAHSFEVVLFVLIPACLPRIGAAFILATSRALGETMAVTLAAGATPNMSWNPLESIQTLTAYIVQVSLGDTPAGSLGYLTCFAVAFLLFLITFFMNFLGNIILTKSRKTL